MESSRGVRSFGFWIVACGLELPKLLGSQVSTYVHDVFCFLCWWELVWYVVRNNDGVGLLYGLAFDSLRVGHIVDLSDGWRSEESQRAALMPKTQFPPRQRISGIMDSSTTLFPSTSAARRSLSAFAMDPPVSILHVVASHGMFARPILVCRKATDDEDNAPASA